MRDDVTLPGGWTRTSENLRSGGQAIAIPAQHEDGRHGVYRQLKEQPLATARRRFQRELEILTDCVDHKSIVDLYDWNGDAELPWYISELGKPFDTWWKRQRRDLRREPEALVTKAVDVLVRLSSALALCHQNGIVHRDIKPKNIIMKHGVPDPWPLLIDFGIAHIDDEERLTSTDEAVGNIRFSPDIMRHRLDEVTPWLDVFDLSQLLIWMLEKTPPKNHWQRPVHWRYAVYREDLDNDTELSIRAFTAACSNEETAPANGAEAAELLDVLFPSRSTADARLLDAHAIVAARRRGKAKQCIDEASVFDEVQASAPLANKVYSAIRGDLKSVFQELVKVDTSARVTVDNDFQYQVRGASDLFEMCVGEQDKRIRIRVKTKIVLRSATTPVGESNRAFWKENLPDDAICFTFALEGGVVEANSTRYLQGKWVTISRNGSIYLHPLSAAFGRFANNDLGGSVEGPGVPASMSDIREFAMSILENEQYWEYVTAG